MAMVNEVTLLGDFEPEPTPLPAPASSVGRARIWMRRNKLRLALVTADTIALALGWMIPLFLLPYNHTRNGFHVTAVYLGGIVLGLVIIRANELYLFRIATVRTVEMFAAVPQRRAARPHQLRAVPHPAGAVELAGGAPGVCRLARLPRHRPFDLPGLAHQRPAPGAVPARDVLVVGTRGEGADLVDLMQCHPDLGFRVVGVAGDREDADNYGLGDLWCTTAEDAPSLVGPGGIGGVVIAARDVFAHHVLNDLVRRLQQRHAHIHLSTGRGIDYRRLRALPLAHEPLFYVEETGLRRSQLAIRAGHRPRR